MSHLVLGDLDAVQASVNVQLGEQEAACLGRLEGAVGALAVIPQPGEGVEAAGAILPLHLQQPFPLQRAHVPHCSRHPGRR